MAGRLVQRRLLLICIIAIAPLIESFQFPTFVSQKAPGKPQTAPFRSPKNSSQRRRTSSSDDDKPETTPVPDSVSTRSPVDMAISAIGVTTSTVVSAIFFCTLAWKRDAFMIAFFIGSITNGVLSKVLKKLLNQSRPQALQTATMKLKPSDGGMPSSHAMSLGFIATFTTLSLWSLQADWFAWSACWPFVLWSYVAVSLVYRVQADLHTWQQVAVGITVGTANACVFRSVCLGPISEWVAANLLNEVGVLPWPFLTVPAFLGLIIVGSFERRISAWIKSAKKEE